VGEAALEPLGLVGRRPRRLLTAEGEPARDLGPTDGARDGTADAEEEVEGFLLSRLPGAVAVTDPDPDPVRVGLMIGGLLIR